LARDKVAREEGKRKRKNQEKKNRENDNKKPIIENACANQYSKTQKEI
jgi:hypothetical protein